LDERNSLLASGDIASSLTDKIKQPPASRARTVDTQIFALGYRPTAQRNAYAIIKPGLTKRIPERE
jgi:hypothetical protein